MARTINPQPASHKPKANKTNIIKTITLTTMVLPGAIWLLLLRYVPMIGIVSAFQAYTKYYSDPSFLNNIMHSKFSGLKNFEFLFASTDAYIMIRNTVGYNLLWILLGLVISVSLAIMISEITKKIIAKTYQTMMFFPYFLSWVVVSYFVYAFLSPDKGLIVHMQQNAGGTVIDWYNNPDPWPVILTIASVWKNVGYSCILYLAAITGIDSSQYEAARIDGASKFQQIWYVTIPHLQTMIIILLIMNVGKIFNADFGLFYSVPMASGPLTKTTLVVDVFVFNALKATKDIGMSTAAGLFQNTVGFICIMITNTIVRKVNPDSALF